MSQGSSNPGVAGPPAAPQASDLVTKFHTMLQLPKDKEKKENKDEGNKGNKDIVKKENKDEGNKDIVASNKEPKNAMVMRSPAAAGAKVLRRPAASGALVAGPQDLVAGPQKRDAAAFKLPPGWTKGKVQRTSGASVGKWDTYYYNPAGDRFRTQGEVMQEIV